MKLFLISLGAFAAAMTGMAIGVLLGKRRLRGSCGGLAGLRDEHGNVMCDACTNPVEECTEMTAEEFADVEDSQTSADRLRFSGEASPRIPAGGRSQNGSH